VVAHHREREPGAASLGFRELGEEGGIGREQLDAPQPCPPSGARFGHEGLHPRGRLEEHRDLGPRILIHRPLDLFGVRLAHPNPPGEASGQVVGREVRRLGLTQPGTEDEPLFVEEAEGQHS